MDPPHVDETLIAPCGMNCGVCRAYLRSKNPCHGCGASEQDLPKSRANCRMRLCAERSDRFCCDCAGFPCDRLRLMDRRYRVRYGMSEVENLEFIRENGLEEFLARERALWISDRGVLCVHDRKYYRSHEDS